MLLAIDAGNTNIVFAVCEGDDIRVQWRTNTKVSRTADEYAVWLAQLLAFEGLSFADLHHAIIATVVPAAIGRSRSCQLPRDAVRSASRPGFSATYRGPRCKA